MDFSKITGVFRKKKADEMPYLELPPDFDSSMNLDMPDDMGPMPDIPDLNIPDLPDLPDMNEKNEDKGYLADISKPEKKEFKERLPVPPLPSIKRESRFQSSRMADLPELPELPDFDEPKKDFRKLPMPPVQKQLVRPETILAHPARQSILSQEIPENMEPSYIGREKDVIYTNVKDFAKIQDTIKSARSMARKMDADITIMSESEMRKDKQFDSMRRHMEDVQRKLMIIDRTLFEGGG